MAGLEALRHLAEQGDLDTQYRLGTMYARGLGADRDLAEAARWWRKAAEQGHAAAQNNLGFMLATGRGVPPDAVEAAHWLGEAARRGHAEAMANLSVLYLTGLGVTRNAVQAYRYLVQALPHLAGPARDRAEKRLESIASRLTRAQRGEALRLAQAHDLPPEQAGGAPDPAPSSTDQDVPPRRR